MSSRRKYTDVDKWCNHCKQQLPHSAFGKNKSSVSGLARYCKECCRRCSSEHQKKHPRKSNAKAVARATKWNNEHPERYRKTVRKSQRLWRLKNVYHITPEQYSQMWHTQNGRCFLTSCNGPAEFIDHDHETDMVRGLLCRRCNSALGFFRDNPQLMREGAEYIERFKNA